MNRVTEILDLALREMFSGNAGEILSIGLEVLLAEVSDEELEETDGGYLFGNAIEFEKARRSGNVTAWSFCTEVVDGVLSIRYTVTPVVAISFIALSTTIGAPPP